MNHTQEHIPRMLSHPAYTQTNQLIKTNISIWNAYNLLNNL